MRKTSVRFSFVLFLATFCLTCWAQQTLIHTYTVGDGLVMNRVRGFHQDKDGFIWMYTWDGLSRYEGYRFRNYIAGRDLQHSFINDIYELPDGTMYLPLNDGSLAVLHNQEVDSAHLNPGAVINAFCKVDGRVYIGMDDMGVGIFKDGELINLKHDPRLTSVLQLIYHQDHFFFIGPYLGPSGVLDKNLNLVAEWPGPAANHNSIYKDHTGRIFLCTQSGLKEVDLSTSSFTLKDPSILPADAPWKNWDINAIIVTPENDFWIGSSQGLIHLRSDHSWSIITIQDGLLSNHISSLFLDRANILWIGTDAGAASINLQTQITNNRNLPGLQSNFILPNADGSVYVVNGFKYLSQVNKQMKIIRSADMSKKEQSPVGLIPGHDRMFLLFQLDIEELSPALFPFEHPDTVYPTRLYSKLNHKFWVTSAYGFQCGTYPGPLRYITGITQNVNSLAPARNNQFILGTLQDGIFLAKPTADPNSCDFEMTDLSPCA